MPFGKALGPEAAEIRSHHPGGGADRGPRGREAGAAMRGRIGIDLFKGLHPASHPLAAAAPPRISRRRSQPDRLSIAMTISTISTM